MFFVIISHNKSVEVPIISHIYQPFFLVCFFFVSGYLFKGSDFLDSIRKIIRSLIVPYFILSIIYGIINPAFIKSIYNQSVLVYLSNLGTNIISGSLFWFISCIIIVQILYSIIYCVFSKKNNYYRIITAIVGLSSIYFIKRQENGSLFWSSDTAIYALGWFALGHYYKLHSSFKINSVLWRRIISIILVAVYISIALLIDWSSLHIYYDMGNNRFDNPTIQLFLSLFGCLAICMLAQSFNKGKFFTLLGQNTLVTYIFHGSIGFPIVSLLFKLTHLDFIRQEPYLFIIVYTFFVALTMIGLSWLFSRYFPFVVGKKHKTSQ